MQAPMVELRNWSIQLENFGKHLENLGLLDEESFKDQYPYIYEDKY